MPRGGARPGTSKKVRDWSIVEAVYEMAEHGDDVETISKETGVSVTAINLWLSSPDEFSPFIDQVAVTRALAGDGPVYARLTPRERARFWELLVTEYDDWRNGWRAHKSLDPRRDRFGKETMEEADYPESPLLRILPHVPHNRGHISSLMSRARLRLRGLPDG